MSTKTTSTSQPPEGYVSTHIDDATLDALAEIGRRAKLTGQLTDIDATLIFHCVGPVAEELRNRRRAFATLHDLTAPNVVRLFPGAEG